MGKAQKVPQFMGDDRLKIGKFLSLDEIRFVIELHARHVETAERRCRRGAGDRDRDRIRREDRGPLAHFVEGHLSDELIVEKNAARAVSGGNRPTDGPRTRSVAAVVDDVGTNTCAEKRIPRIRRCSDRGSLVGIKAAIGIERDRNRGEGPVSFERAALVLGKLTPSYDRSGSCVIRKSASLCASKSTKYHHAQNFVSIALKFNWLN